MFSQKNAFSICAFLVICQMICVVANRSCAFFGASTFVGALFYLTLRFKVATHLKNSLSGRIFYFSISLYYTRKIISRAFQKQTAVSRRSSLLISLFRYKHKNNNNRNYYNYNCNYYTNHRARFAFVHSCTGCVIGSVCNIIVFVV